MTGRRGYKDLLEEAERQVAAITPEQAAGRAAEAGTVLIDLREAGERRRDGCIAGAVHVPRGMLEFWVDPESPYYKPAFDAAERYILFCAAGWRSALAAKTLQDMGFGPVEHMAGGFKAWKEAGLPVEADGR